MIKLAAELKQALQFYFSNPDNKDYRNWLVSVSYAVLRDIQIQTSIGSDDYMDGVDTFLSTCSLDTIQMSEDKSKKLDEFIRGLSRIDDSNVRQASNVLLLAQDRHINHNFISSSEDAICSRLVTVSKAKIHIAEAKIQLELHALRQAVIQMSHNASLKTMDEACGLLEQIVAAHFSLSNDEQRKNHPLLVETVNEIYSESKQIIDSDVLLKQITYNLLAAVVGLGVFYGLYLMLTATKRNTFFLQPAEAGVLNNAFVKIAEVQKDLTANAGIHLDAADAPTNTV